MCEEYELVTEQPDDGGKLKILFKRKPPSFEFEGQMYYSHREVELSCEICGTRTWLSGHRNFLNGKFSGSKVDICYSCARRHNVVRLGLSEHDSKNLYAAKGLISAILREAKNAG